MDGEQLQAIVQAIQAIQVGGGGKKVSPFSSAIPADWLVWRRHFRTVAQINNWDDVRQRREAAAAMEGEAGRLCKNIEYEPADDAAFNIGALLDLYEAQFMPPTESDLAVANFDSAKQKSEDSIIKWASRLQALYERAYPGQGIDHQIAIKRFILGLRDPEVATYVHEHRPATFQEAKELAGNKTASKQFLYNHFPGRKGGLHAMGAGQKDKDDDITCFFCGGNHRQVDCPLYQAAREKCLKSKGRSTGTSRRGRRRGAGGRSVNNIDGTPDGQEDGENDDSPGEDVDEDELDEFAEPDETEDALNF